MAFLMLKNNIIKFECTKSYCFLFW